MAKTRVPLGNSGLDGGPDTGPDTRPDAGPVTRPDSHISKFDSGVSPMERLNELEKDFFSELEGSGGTDSLRYEIYKERDGEWFFVKSVMAPANVESWGKSYGGGRYWVRARSGNEFKGSKKINLDPDVYPNPVGGNNSVSSGTLAPTNDLHQMLGAMMTVMNEMVQKLSSKPAVNPVSEDDILNRLAKMKEIIGGNGQMNFDPTVVMKQTLDLVTRTADAGRSLIDKGEEVIKDDGFMGIIRPLLPDIIALIRSRGSAPVGQAPMQTAEVYSPAPVPVQTNPVEPVQSQQQGEAVMTTTNPLILKYGKEPAVINFLTRLYFALQDDGNPLIYKQRLFSDPALANFASEVVKLSDQEILTALSETGPEFKSAIADPDNGEWFKDLLDAIKGRIPDDPTGSSPN